MGYQTITHETSEVIRLRDGWAVAHGGRVASARWAERGPAEAQLSLLRKGYSVITESFGIKHVPATPLVRHGCPHCRSTAKRVACAQCHREMCEDCISPGQLCGLCFDKEAHDG